jgi:RHS repeat-associated protein
MELQNKIYKSLLLTAGAFLFINTTATAQTATQNYISTRAPRVPITTNARLDQLTPVKDSVMTTVQYIDGLGRLLQTVQRQASPAGYDIIQPNAYDAYGREPVKYLPYVNSTTNYATYRLDALGDTTGVKAFYNPSKSTTEGNRSSGVVITPYPFATTVFEASPLNRPVEQGATGAAWQVNGTPGAGSGNNTRRLLYLTNDQVGTFSTSDVSSANGGSRKAALYKAAINANGSRSLKRAGNSETYLSGQLVVTVSRGENWKPADGCFGSSEEYKDKNGRVVLNRTYNIRQGATPAAEMLSTYYVYDDLNNLCFVLPPGARPDSVAAISQATIDTRCYQYRYDARNRLTQKRVPGKGWEFVIYNRANKAIATQDSVQRMKATQEWTITKYDAVGRAVLTATYQYGATPGADNRAAVQSAADAVTPLWESPISTGTGYTSNAWPVTVAQVLSTNYYDTYSNIPLLPSMYNQLANTLYTKRTTGLLTATKTLVLNTAGDYLWSVPYYDEDGQVIRTFTQHYVGGSSALSQYNYDDVTTGYNFAKQVTSNYRLHYIANTAKTARIQKLLSSEAYSYDHMGRRRSGASQLQDTTNTIQPPVRVSLASYNELGQLIKKGLHAVNGTSNFLQNVDYRYNPRGWLTNINNPALTADFGVTNTDSNDQFGIELKYDNAATPEYNGNIGSSTVKTVAVAGTTYPALNYNYTYDKLNRLTDAISTTAIPNDGFYNESLSYDQMGNIQTLKRYDKNGTNAQLIDNLTYTYVSGNKVDRIDDAGTATGFNNTASQAGEYTYDGNGSQLIDLNKGLTQSYNMLNLPQTAVKSGVSVAYIYDAAGGRLRKLSTSGSITTVTEYVNGIQYEYSGATPTISFIQTEEGRARKSPAGYKYEYDLKDHLGDTRLTTTWNPADVNQLTPLTLQRNDYYAFGYTIQSTQYAVYPKNQYLYNHKELQEETWLYDYGARQYDPAIGRWTSVDPLAGKSMRWSPYNYVEDNPVIKVDPDGMESQQVQDWEGNWHTVQTKTIYQKPADEGNGEKPTFFQRIMAMFGISLNPPSSSQEAVEKEKANDKFNFYKEQAEESYRKMDETYGSIPFVGGTYNYSKGMVNHDNKYIIYGAGSLLFDSVGGEFLKGGGTSLTRLLESLGFSPSKAKVFFGWGKGTALTKTLEDFTKEELLANGWTKENLVKLARTYNEQIVKAQLKGPTGNPAALIRRDQAMALARRFFK